MTLLFRDFDRRIEIRSTREGLIRFHRMSEAVLYLRKNFHRTGVVSTLRQVLSDHQRMQVSRMSDEEVIEEIARRIMDGSLQLMEFFEPRAGVALLTTITEAPVDPIEPEPAPAEEEEEEEEVEPPLDLDAETEGEPVPDIVAGLESTEPPEVDMDAEVDETLALGFDAQTDLKPEIETEPYVEPPPTVESQAAVSESAAPTVGTKADIPPEVATNVAATEPPAAPRSDVSSGTSPKPGVGGTTANDPGIASDTSVGETPGVKPGHETSTGPSVASNANVGTDPAIDANTRVDPDNEQAPPGGKPHPPKPRR